MLNNPVFVTSNSNISSYNKKTHTLTIKNVNNDTYFINIDNNIKTLHLKIINSNINIIENYLGNITNCSFTIDIDNNSSLNRCSILVDNTTQSKIFRNVNNNGQYISMQIDLTDNNIYNQENIYLLSENAYTLVTNGIYAFNKNIKNYQTNLNHLVPNCISKAQIFAVNNDFAHVNISTDAYIKNKAAKTKTTQEGRIINLKDTCSGIVFPNLHIDENDVEASHSCSVGSLNQEHIYYLQSRGLSLKQAQNVLIKGYFNPILENIIDETIKNEITKVLTKRIG